MTKGSLVVVSGFSGVGKGTVMKSLVARYEGMSLSISATTRAPRAGEENGREYFFLTKEAFEQLIEENGLVEYACYCGNYYGTPRAFVEQQLEAGRDVLLEIEIQGALKIKKQYPDALLIFIMPPSGEELKRRLIGRGTESADVIESRLRRAVEESEGIENYDYIFVNDEVEACADRIHELIQSKRHETDKNSEFISRIRSEIRNF